jgi:hypothetical protein
MLGPLPKAFELLFDQLTLAPLRQTVPFVTAVIVPARAPKTSIFNTVLGATAEIDAKPDIGPDEVELKLSGGALPPPPQAVMTMALTAMLIVLLLNRDRCTTLNENRRSAGCQPFFTMWQEISDFEPF